MEKEILAAIEAAGRLTTRQLVAQLSVDRSGVFRACSRLEKQGRLTSQLMEPTAIRYFFPPTQEVMNRGNHTRIEELGDDFRSLVSKFSLPAEGAELIEALQIHFERLLERADLAEFQDPLEDFAEELIEAAKGATKKGNVTSLLGLRPMPPKERVWAMGRQLTLV